MTFNFPLREVELDDGVGFIATVKSSLLSSFLEIYKKVDSCVFILAISMDRGELSDDESPNRPFDKNSE